MGSDAKEVFAQFHMGRVSRKLLRLHSGYGFVLIIVNGRDGFLECRDRS